MNVCFYSEISQPKYGSLIRRFRLDAPFERPKMNLGYLVPEFPNQTHAFFWRECKALRGLGVRVVLLSTRCPQIGACHHDFADEARRQTFYAYPPPWIQAAALLVLRPIRTWRAIRYVAKLSQTPPTRRAKLMGLVACGAIVAQHARVKHLNHIHIHSCADAAHLGAIQRILGGPSYSLSLHGDLQVYGTDHANKISDASFVAAVTRPLQTVLMEEFQLSPDRAPLVQMGVETEHFVENNQRKSSAGHLHVCTVARLNQSKGHRYALSAVRRAIDRGCHVTYSVAGDGPFRSAIEVEIKSLALTECVRLLGSISETEVLDLLQGADAFLLPSVGRGEAAPVSVMEAMSCGLPVICSIIGGTPDMITDNRDGILVSKGDVVAICDALIRLCMNLEERRRLGAAARQRALKQFDYRVSARRLLSAIEQDSKGSEQY